jgi:hypothetical protein
MNVAKIPCEHASLRVVRQITHRFQQLHVPCELRERSSVRAVRLGQYERIRETFLLERVLHVAAETRDAADQTLPFELRRRDASRLGRRVRQESLPSVAGRGVRFLSPGLVEPITGSRGDKEAVV